jgi:hypothetical protein
MIVRQRFLGIGDAVHMTTSERVTIAISMFALLLAGLTLYYSEFRRADELEAVVLDSDPLGGIIDYQVAILNNGNKSALITSARLEIRSKMDELHVDNPLSKVQLNLSLPVLIEKNGILVVKFHGPMNLESMYHRGEVPVDKSEAEFNGEATRKVFIEARLTAIDSTGETNYAITGPISAVITKSKVAISGHAAKRARFHR